MAIYFDLTYTLYDVATLKFTNAKNFPPPSSHDAQLNPHACELKISTYFSLDRECESLVRKLVEFCVPSWWTEIPYRPKIKRYSPRRTRNEAKCKLRFVWQTRRNFQERKRRRRTLKRVVRFGGDVTSTLLRLLPVVSRQVKYRRPSLISAAAHDFFVNGSMPAELYSHIDRRLPARGNTGVDIFARNRAAWLFSSRPTYSKLISSWRWNERSCQACRN